MLKSGPRGATNSPKTCSISGVFWIYEDFLFCFSSHYLLIIIIDSLYVYIGVYLCVYARACVRLCARALVCACLCIFVVWGRVWGRVLNCTINILQTNISAIFIFFLSYEFRLRVALGPGGDLMLTSRIRNTNNDGKTFSFTFAYHTYFLVSDIRFVERYSGGSLVLTCWMIFLSYVHYGYTNATPLY